MSFKIMSNCKYNSEFVLNTDLFVMRQMKSGLSHCVLKCYNHHTKDYVIVKPVLSGKRCNALNQDKEVLKRYDFFNKRFSTAHRATIVYEIFKQLELNCFIPLTGAGVDLKIFCDICSICEFVDGTKWDDTFVNKNENVFIVLAFMDTLLGYNDRHSGNIVISGNNIKLIDNDTSFDYSHVFGLKHPVYTKRLLNSQLNQKVREFILKINPDSILSVFPKDTPKYILKTLLKRLGVAKRYCYLTLGNPHFSNNLGTLMDLMKCEISINSTRIQGELKDKKSHLWNNIKRSNAYTESENIKLEDTLIIT